MNDAAPAAVHIDERRFEGHIPRRRDRQFVAALLAELATNGGEISEGVLLNAAQQAWKAQHTDPADARKELVRRAKMALNLSNVAQAIAEFYGVEAGFTHADAVKLHVRHIKGIRYKETVVDPQTGYRSEQWVRKAPSYAALKDFLAMTMPKEAKQINIDSRNLTLRATMPYQPPEIDATTIADTTPPLESGKKKR